MATGIFLRKGNKAKVQLPHPGRNSEVALVVALCRGATVESLRWQVHFKGNHNFKVPKNK